MLELERLQEIVSRLTIDEINSIKKDMLLRANSKDLKSNSAKLFEIILSSDEVELSFVSNILYGKKNYAALRKLSQRLIDRLIESLISKESIIESDIYDARSKEIFTIKRKLLYYDVLALHGITNFALAILNQVILQAKKLEYYSYLIIALEKKLIKMSLGKGLEVFNETYDEIKFYSDCDISLRNSSYLLRLYSSNFEYNQKVFTDSILKSKIRLVESDFMRTNSKSINVNLFYLKGIYLYNNEKFKECKDNFKLLYKYMKNNKNIAFDTNIANSLVNIAECETMLFDFSSSLRYLKIITDKFIKNQYNFKLIMEMKFINCYYNGDLFQAKHYLNPLLELNSQSNISNYIQAKRLYYFASVKFIEYEFNESYRILNECRILERDKDGWNIGVRILLILNNIEIGKLILVESQIENLRKHLSRVDNSGVLFPRFMLILKVLIGLMNNSFNFNDTHSLYQSDLIKLCQIRSKYSWKIKSPEMILFHEWFQSKVDGVPYDHVNVMKKLKKLNKKQ